MSNLTTAFRNNPLAPNPQGGGNPVMRLVANPTSVSQIHDDIPAPTRYNVGIEFATAKGGNTVSKSSHSHAMTEDAMDLGEGQAKQLTEQQVLALFKSFQAGKTKKLPRLVR